MICSTYSTSRRSTFVHLYCNKIRSYSLVLLLLLAAGLQLFWIGRSRLVV